MPASTCRCREDRLGADVNEANAPLALLLVDDEPLARLRLRQLLDGDATATVVGEAADAGAALEWLAAHDCDVVLLDIALPGKSGLKLADELRRQPQPPQVVFLTAHPEHALQAFELEALDYLTKPVRRERLQAALLRARRRRVEQPADGAPPTLIVSDRGRVLRLLIADLICLKAEQKYVAIVTRGGHWLVDDALTDLEQRLGAAVVRVHRNALAAVAAVRALEPSAGAGDGAEGWSVLLAGGERLAVSRRQLSAVRAALAGR